MFLSFCGCTGKGLVNSSTNAYYSILLIFLISDSSTFCLCGHKQLLYWTSSISDAVGTNSHIKSVLQRPGIAAFCDLSKLPAYGGKNLSSRKRHAALLVSCAKTSEATISAKGGLSLFSSATEKQQMIYWVRNEFGPYIIKV